MSKKTVYECDRCGTNKSNSGLLEAFLIELHTDCWNKYGFPTTKAKGHLCRKCKDDFFKWLKSGDKE